MILSFCRDRVTDTDAFTGYGKSNGLVGVQHGWKSVSALDMRAVNNHITIFITSPKSPFWQAHSLELPTPQHTVP